MKNWEEATMEKLSFAETKNTFDGSNESDFEFYAVGDQKFELSKALS